MAAEAGGPLAGHREEQRSHRDGLPVPRQARAGKNRIVNLIKYKKLKN
jgi:hypothetical protein